MSVVDDVADVPAPVGAVVVAVVVVAVVVVVVVLVAVVVVAALVADADVAVVIVLGSDNEANARRPTCRLQRFIQRFPILVVPAASVRSLRWC